MKHFMNPCARKSLITLLAVTIVTTLSAQASLYWNLNGNAASNGQFIGTTNNEPLIFKTNGLEAMRIKPNGNLQINAFQNMGKGLVWANNGGVLNMTPFPNDTNQVFTGSGNFKSIATLSGWTRTGSVLYNSTGVRVGIGTATPQYLLDVNGDAFFNGIVYATGVVLANKMLVDTLKANNMFSLNNNLHMSAGGLNQIYTSTGDLRFQSNAGNTGNTIFHAGTSGFVGIGTYSPQYKLDVVGKVRFVNDVYVSRLRPLPGDSIISIGDSSIILSSYNGINNIRPSQRGLGIGSISAFARGTNSLAFGQKVVTDISANNAIVIGSGVLLGNGALTNTVPNSMMIGFNSDKPTIFVAPAAGAGTIGRVGFGTTSPDALFQVNGSSGRITMDQCGTNQQGFVSYIGFNVSRDPNTGWYTTRGDGQQNSGSALTQDNEGALRFYVFGNTGSSDQSIDPVHFQSLAILTLRSNRIQIGQREILSTSPFNDADTKLTVDGRILCTDLIVSDVDWQDEVFDSTYTLMPLDSVASYIKQYGHLPDVKSDTEIEQNGMSVAETAATQQQKIEELTLYLIELNARLKAVEEENARLKAEQEKLNQQPK